MTKGITQDCSLPPSRSMGTVNMTVIHHHMHRLPVSNCYHSIDLFWVKFFIETFLFCQECICAFSRGFSPHSVGANTSPQYTVGLLPVIPHCNAVRGFSECVCGAARPDHHEVASLTPPSSIPTALNFNSGQLNINNWYQWGPLYYCWQQYNMSQPKRHNNRSGPTSHIYTQTHVGHKESCLHTFLLMLRTHKELF